MCALGDLVGTTQAWRHATVFKSVTAGFCNARCLTWQSVYDPVGIDVGVAVPDGGGGAGDV